MGGLFSRSLQEGLELQKSAVMLLGALSALGRFQVPLSTPAVPDGSSEQLIMGDPLPSWRLWVGKRLLVSVQLPT